MSTRAPLRQSREAAPGGGVSILLPSFNHGAYLPAALDALLAQSIAPGEIIIVDDGSTDDSAAIARRYAQADLRVSLLENGRNLGTIASLNRGLSLATGAYVYCAAADDFVEPHLLATLLPQLQAEPEAALACGEMQVITDQGAPVGVRPIVRPSARAAYLDPAAVRRLLQHSDQWILTGAALFRRAAMVEAGGFDPELGFMADSFLSRRLALQHGFCFVPEVVAHLRVSETGVSRSMGRDPALVNALIARASARMQADPVYPAGYAGVFARRLRFAVARLALLRHPISQDVLTEVAALSPMDARLYRLACRSGWLGRLGALGWSFLRLRPMSAVAVLRTALARKLRRYSTGN